jgi:hypothetical protein
MSISGILGPIMFCISSFETLLMGFQMIPRKGSIRRETPAIKVLFEFQSLNVLLDRSVHSTALSVPNLAQHPESRIS